MWFAKTWLFAVCKGKSSSKLTGQSDVASIGWATEFNGKSLPSGRKALVPRERPVYLKWDSNHALVKDIGTQQLK